MGADLLDGDVELTEFTELDVQSIKGVKQGATGFPILLMKGLPGEPPAAGDDGTAEKSAAAITAAAVAKAVTDGEVDEGPDIDLGHQIMGLLARAIQGEAAEIGAGAYGETCDVDLLNCAASMISRWVSREAGPGEDDGDDMGMLMASAAIKAKLSAAEKNNLPDSAFAYIEDGGEKDSEGKTTPRSKRHFPVHDKAHADDAAARIAQGAKFGDKAKAKVEAAQKKFGESDAGKSVAEGETSVQDDAQGTGSLQKAVEDAVTKATAPLGELRKELEEVLAKVKATPVPGGPVLSAVRPQAASGGDDWAAKAAYYGQKAEQAVNPADRDGYRQLAREAQAKAQAATA